jgi:uncharacterized protein (DUF885 family)
MTQTRRDLLASAAAAGAALALPVAALAQSPPAADPALRTLVDAFASEMLDEAPETATSLGLDTGARAGLKSRLDDRSAAAAARDTEACAARLTRLKAIDRPALKGFDASLYDAVVYANELGVEGGRFGYGDNTYAAAMDESATPYVVSQEGGDFNTVPEFLNSQHKVANAADAEAYLARLSAFAVCLDQETARVRRDAGQGVIAPDFLLKTALSQMIPYRATPAATAHLVTSLTTRTDALGLRGDYAARATRIVETAVYPALDRQIAALQSCAAKAGHDAGVWRLPDGEAYYAWLLKVGASTAMTADEVHQMGLEQNREIQARMDAILKAQGLTQGTVGARVGALSKDPRFLYPNDAAGKAQLIAYLNGRIAAMRPLLPQMSKMNLKAQVVVKAVPTDIELGAGLGYMNFGALDGSRPSIYYINLHDTGVWPRFTLPTLTFHETIPGHAWQGAYLAERHDQIPLISSLMGFNAFVEGWALYAEQLADELGLYADDPFGQIGYLQAQQFRACRLVADTGLHAKRWSREKIVAFLVEQTGRAPAAMTSEVDRYCGTPGQACGYKIGHTEINRLRDKAKAALGPRYDLRDFNDVVVQTGGVPLTVLATVVEGYIARTERA